MLKILQARLQEYVNRELPDVKAGFRKSRGALAAILRPRVCVPNLSWSARDHLSANPSPLRGPISAPTRELLTERRRWFIE